MCFLKKRPKWWLRLILGCGICLLGVYALGYSWHIFEDPPIEVACVLYPSLMGLLLWICCDISMLDAAYGAICVYGVEHLASVGSMVVRILRYDSLYFELWQLPERALIYAVIYTAAAVLLFRTMVRNGAFEIKNPVLLLSGLLLFVIAEVLYMDVLEMRKIAGMQMVTYALLFDMLCCSLFLCAQALILRYARIQVAMELERSLRQRQAEQYELTRETIDIIDRKCHDLKHQIAALRSIDNTEVREQSIREIEEAIMLYSAMMKTGNEILDTVLTDKYLYCERNGITWMCTADGSKLDFMDPVDLYVMFGNALDNAIEAVMGLQEAAQRVIAVTVTTKKNAVNLQVENYYDRELTFKDGLPQTTKKDDGYHGIGMRSIQHIAKKYGGSMQVETDQNIFVLSIMLPAAT